MRDPRKNDEDCATKTGTGNESQSAAVFRSEVASERTEAAKYRLSRMTAIAVKRCNLNSRGPSRALPNWRDGGTAGRR
jgi:hypothetical protein